VVALPVEAEGEAAFVGRLDLRGERRTVIALTGRQRATVVLRGEHSQGIDLEGERR
jgi:hypothetical protein